MARTKTDLTLASVAATSVPFAPPRLVSTRDVGQMQELLDPYTRLPYLEANSQEFVAGDVVALVAGAVTQVLTATASMICGIALTSATNVTSGNIPIRIAPIYPGQIWAISPWTAIGNVANTYPDKLAKMVGTYYNLRQVSVTQPDTTVLTCTALDIETVTMARALVVGVKDPTLGATASYGRLLVTFPSSTSVSADGASWLKNTQLG